LVGERLPQTPLHRGGVTGILDLPDLFRASARVWSESRSYADDRNNFQLPAFAQLDLSLSRPLTKELQMQLSVSNVLDSRVVTSRDASVINVGAPRTAWLALRGTY
jgi:outer membrane receptor protein involved in Fe transport